MSKRSGIRVAVIGAGIAGLSAAYELTKAGFAVVVYEKTQTPGGRMATRFKDGFQFNSGATFLSEDYHQLKSYAAEFGIALNPMASGSQHRVIRSAKSYHYGGRGVLGIFKLNVVSFGARLRLMGWLIKNLFRSEPGNFYDLSTIRPNLDFETAGSYLRRQMGDEAVDYIIDPFTAALHFHRSDAMSSTVVFGMIKLMRSKGNFSARHPAGGMNAIPKKLASRLDMRYGSKVTAVRSANGQCYLKIGSRGERFEAVVLACPAPAALSLLSNPTAVQKAVLGTVRYAATIVLAFRVPLNLFADATQCIYVPYVENKIISCCIFEGRKGQELIQDGQTLLNVYLHDQAARRLMKKSDQEIGRIVQNELAKVCPEARKRSQEIFFHELVRWPYAMPKFAHGTVAVMNNFTRRRQGEGGIFFAGDYLNAPWTEGAARSGKRAAELIVRAWAANSSSVGPSER